MAVNGRIHVVFHRLTEQQLKVKRLKMRFHEISRIHLCGKKLENGMAFSMRYTNCKLWKILCILCFPVFTHINLPGKCVFSAVNSGEYVVVHSENANERKENTLFAMC